MKRRKKGKKNNEYASVKNGAFNFLALFWNNFIREVYMLLIIMLGIKGIELIYVYFIIF